MKAVILASIPLGIECAASHVVGTSSCGALFQSTVSESSASAPWQALTKSREQRWLFEMML